MTLDELLQNPKALPTAPKVLADLIHSFEDPEVSVAQITRTLSADPVLSAKLLRLANSAYYKVSRSIATVEDAVAAYRSRDKAVAVDRDEADDERRRRVAARLAGTHQEVDA